MIIYLSGPMSGYPQFNFPEFHRCAGILRSAGYVVLSPAEFFGDTPDAVTLSRATVLRMDIHALLQVEGVVVLHGWEISRGAVTEVRIAWELGLPVYRFGTPVLPLTTEWLDGFFAPAGAAVLQ
mgnify:CR=1 FL=1